MRFDELEKHDRFVIDGAHYEACTIGERIVIGYALEHKNGTWNYISDPNDLAGDQLLTDAFSDLRFNRNNLTDFERQCDDELKALL